MKPTFYLYLIVAFLSMSSCQDDFCELSDLSVNSLTRSSDDYESFINTDDIDSVLTVGRKLDNPYSVSNMTKALKNLAAASRLKTSDKSGLIAVPELTLDQIKPTHYYVKFSPKSTDELDILEADSTLELFNYPLDHEILGTGMIYRSPEDESFEELYAVWPAEKKFPDSIACEMLENLFIPEEDKVSAELSLSAGFIDQLVGEAFRLTGNNAENPGKGTTSWHPSGKIMVWDDAVNGYIPLVGAKIKATRLFHVNITYTDEFGEFYVKDKYKYGVTYSIVWEGNKWDIRDGKTGQASYRSSQRKGPWKLLIGSHGRQCRFATIHRAAFRHFRLDNCGFSRTRANHKIKIAYLNYYGNRYGTFKHRWWNSTGIFNDILIWGAVHSNDGKDWRLTHQMFSTVSHELGHCAMYYRQGLSRYDAHAIILIESWAKFMGWVIPDKEYEQLGYYGILHEYKYVNIPPMYYRFELPDEFNLQVWSSDRLNNNHYRKYTPLFIDLYDDSNQRYYYKLCVKNSERPNVMLFPNDDISLKNAQILESVLDESLNVNQLKKALVKYKGRFGITDRTLDEFFDIFGK